MTRPTVRLVERRAREVLLPPQEAAFLLAHARHLVDVVPSFRRGRYRLTPRGYVGWFDSPQRRYALAPKIPWPNVRMLLGLAGDAAGSELPPDAELLDVFAREFVAELRAVVRVGLVSGYHDRDTITPFLRGKMRPVDQLRDAAARAFPDRFHVTESVLDLDAPWNRIPRVVADRLLADPTLNPTTRSELRDAMLPLDAVPVTPIVDADFAASAEERRVEHYRPLLSLCRVLHDGFRAAVPGEFGAGGFLIDLSRSFERFLAAGLATALSHRPAWSVEAHPTFPVGPTPLQPDILVRHRTKPRAVLDAKWKAPGATPDAADLHQILAYAAVTGANHVGLVYPGRRFVRRAFSVPGSPISVSLFRVGVVGTVEECSTSIASLARRLRRPGRTE